MNAIGSAGGRDFVFINAMRVKKSRQICLALMPLIVLGLF